MEEVLAMVGESIDEGPLAVYVRTTSSIASSHMVGALTGVVGTTDVECAELDSTCGRPADTSAAGCATMMATAAGAVAAVAAATAVDGGALPGSWQSLYQELLDKLHNSSRSLCDKQGTGKSSSTADVLMHDRESSVLGCRGAAPGMAAATSETAGQVLVPATYLDAVPDINASWTMSNAAAAHTYTSDKDSTSVSSTGGNMCALYKPAHGEAALGALSAASDLPVQAVLAELNELLSGSCKAKQTASGTASTRPGRPVVAAMGGRNGRQDSSEQYNEDEDWVAHWLRSQRGPLSRSSSADCLLVEDAAARGGAGDAASGTASDPGSHADSEASARRRRSSSVPPPIRWNDDAAHAATGSEGSELRGDLLTHLRLVGKAALEMITCAAASTPSAPRTTSSITPAPAPMVLFMPCTLTANPLPLQQVATFKADGRGPHMPAAPEQSGRRLEDVLVAARAALKPAGWRRLQPIQHYQQLFRQRPQKQQMPMQHQPDSASVSPACQLNTATSVVEADHTASSAVSNSSNNKTPGHMGSPGVDATECSVLQAFMYITQLLRMMPCMQLSTFFNAPQFYCRARRKQLWHVWLFSQKQVKCCTCACYFGAAVVVICIASCT